ncbi:hypothetical protein ACHAWC_004827 [Mediolabrus comicus]
MVIVFGGARLVVRRRYCRSPYHKILASSSSSSSSSYYNNVGQNNRTKRWKSSATETTATASQQQQQNAIIDYHQPLAARIALVSSATALATPAFPALGFLYAIIRVTVPDPNLRKVMEGRWGTVLSFTTWTLLPKLYHGAIASLIFPCAMGNALVAGCAYGCLDVISGGPKGSNAVLFQKPWIGTGIGATVGFVAPSNVYGPMFEVMYGLEGMTQSMNYIMSVPFATEVSVVTGAVAGTLLHPLLYVPIQGINGIHWGLPLVAASSALYYMYYGRKETGLPVPEGSYVDPSKLDSIHSILRYNNASGQVETYSLRSQQFIGSTDVCDEGKRIAESSRLYASSGNKVVFDDRLLAFAYNYWDLNTATRYSDHVVSTESLSTLQQAQDSMLVTDASVAEILHKSDLKSIQKTIDDLDDRTLLDGKKRKPSGDMETMKNVNVALRLLMMLQRTPKEEMNENTSFAVDEIPKLERYIRRIHPKIVIYAADEKYKGESVESQLKNTGWEGQNDVSGALEEWKQIQAESYKTWRNRVLLASSVAVSVIGLILSR